MKRAQKNEVIENLRQMMDGARSLVLLSQSGLNVAEMTMWRSELRAAGAGLRVVKNSLARRAVRETRYAFLDSHFSGPSAIAFSNEDPVAAAKISARYAKEYESVSITAGALDGEALDENEVMALAALPSLEEIRAKLAGLLVAPAGRIARLAGEPATRLARLLQAKEP